MGYIQFNPTNSIRILTLQLNNIKASWPRSNIDKCLKLDSDKGLLADPRVAALAFSATASRSVVYRLVPLPEECLQSEIAQVFMKGIKKKKTQ